MRQLVVRMALVSLILAIALAWLPQVAPAVPVAQADGIRPVGNPTVEVVEDDSNLAVASKPGYVRLIVELSDPALAAYDGGIQGFAPTSVQATGRRKLDVNSSAAQAYLTFLSSRQDSFVADLQKAIPGATEDGRYAIVNNGLAIEVPKGQVDAVAALPGVKAVYFDRVESVTMYDSLNIIRATEAWAQVGGRDEAGRGILVGVIDSGIVPTHTMFSDVGFTAPTPGANWGTLNARGTYVCSSNNPKGFCNNKVVVARSYVQTGLTTPVCSWENLNLPFGVNDHGTHVAGTAVGRAVVGSLGGVTKNISGVAPGAYLLAYKGLAATDPENDGFCDGGSGVSTTLLAALNDAAADGVDVVNNSWGGAASDPTTSPYATAINNMGRSGIVVVFSAGNSGPGAATHGCPGCVNEAFSVAATTKSKSFQGTATFSGGTNTPPPAVNGATIGVGVGPAEIVDAANVAGLTPECDGTPAANEVAGKIVLCVRGGNARVDKSRRVQLGGGVGMILYNNAANVTDLANDNHYVPSIHIQYAAGLAIKNWIAGGGTPMATISAASETNILADMMASFSSRGATTNKVFIKPDVAAPGVDIFSASSNNPHLVDPASLFGFKSGTSMAAPHVAGAAALIAAARPTWNGRQIRSALMTTAVETVVKEDGVTPANFYDRGAGRIDVVEALDPGITVEPHPSIALPAVYDSARHRVTVTNVYSVSEVYNISVDSLALAPFAPTAAPTVTVEPSVITVPPGGTATFDVVIDAENATVDEYFTNVRLDGNQGHDAHMPVYINVALSPLADDIVKSADRTTVLPGEFVTYTLTITNNQLSATTYFLTDTLPSGMVVDPASITGGATYDPVNNRILWNGPIAAPSFNYTLTDSRNGGRSLAFNDISGIAATALPCSTSCDETNVNYGLGGPTLSLYGQPFSTIRMSTNGFIYGFDQAANSGSVAQNLPNPTAPNNLFAALWNDMDLNGTSPTDPGAGTWHAGVFTGVDASRPNDQFLVMQWKNVDQYSMPTSDINFNIYARLNSTLGEMCAVYSTLTGDLVQGGGNGTEGFSGVSVGIENALGTVGSTHYFNGAPAGNTPAPGVTVCANASGTYFSHTITYRASSATPGTKVNTVEINSTSQPGTGRDAATVAVLVPTALSLGTLTATSEGSTLVLTGLVLVGLLGAAGLVLRRQRRA